MTEIIKKEIIDFKDLVEKGKNRISINFQSKFINKLNNEFNDEEQKWYIANFYVFLNYHQTEEYPINLENVYEMIGFANKGNAKRTLVNNFNENDDYKIVILPRENNLRKDLGGRNEEKILLNVDTFKMICMLAKTENGKKIRKYYIKLENIYNNILNEEREFQENNGVK